MTGRELAAELDRLGIHFVRNDAAAALRRPLPAEDLIAGLACSDEARLRLAIIPLLLWRPDYASAVPAVVAGLSAGPRVLLQCYYTAAMLLQPQYESDLAVLRGWRETLPDLDFGLGLGSDGNAGRRLEALAQRQAELSGESINWRGTYEHAARVFVARLSQGAA